MLKSLQKNKCFIFFVILILGLLVGKLSSFSHDYFYISFSDLFSNLINVILAIIVAYFIGRKLNKNIKVIDLQLEGIAKFEDKIEELDQLYLLFISKNNDNQSITKTKRLFTQTSELLELLSHFNFLNEQKELYDKLKSDFANYWKNFLDPITIDSFSEFDSAQKILIDDSKRAVNASIYRLKISAFK